MTAINPSRLDRKHRLTRFAVREHGGNILFMLPAFALFAFVVLIPFLQSIPTSFTDKKAIFAKEWNFVGFENYGKLLKSASFRDSFLHTFQFTIVYIIGANMLGLALALLLWKSGPFNNVMRTLLFMPFTVSLVASTKVWSYVYTDVLSPLTGAPSPLGISSQVIYGLAAIAIWRDMGYCMLIYIAAHFAGILRGGPGGRRECVPRIYPHHPAHDRARHHLQRDAAAFLGPALLRLLSNGHQHENGQNHRCVRI